MVASNSMAGMAAACAQGVWIVYSDGRLSVGLSASQSPFLSAQVTMPAGASLQIGLAANGAAVTYTKMLVLSVGAGAFLHFSSFFS